MKGFRRAFLVAALLYGGDMLLAYALSPCDAQTPAVATITPKSCSFNAGLGSANTPVCQFSAITVPAGQAVTWGLNGGPNAKMFVLSPSGQLSVGPADVPAATAPYVVYVRGVAADGAAASISIKLIGDGVATITPKSCSFNAGPGSANQPICQFSAVTVPAGGAATWALNGGPNAGLFVMSPTGQLSVGPADVPVSKVSPTGTPIPYVVYVRGSDGGAASISIKLIGLPPAPAPIITFTPPAPSIESGSPDGSFVTAYAITMPDGSSFTGSVAFAAPYFDAGSMFALTNPAGNGNIIVNPAGPGLPVVLPGMSPITEMISVQATTGAPPSGELANGSSYMFHTANGCMDDGAVANEIVLTPAASCTRNFGQVYAWNGGSTGDGNIGSLFNVNTGSNPEPLGSLGSNQGAAGSTFTITPVTGGYTVREDGSGLYLQDSPFGLGQTQTVWSID